VVGAEDVKGGRNCIMGRSKEGQCSNVGPDGGSGGT